MPIQELAHWRHERALGCRKHREVVGSSPTFLTKLWVVSSEAEHPALTRTVEISKFSQPTNYSLVALTFKSAFFAKRDGGGNPSEGAKLRVRSSIGRALVF